MEARVGIEPTHKGFADLSLTTWVPRHSVQQRAFEVRGRSSTPLLCPVSVHQEGGNCLERETGVEPATSSLARKHSTTELLPLAQVKYIGTATYGQRRATLPLTTHTEAVARPCSTCTISPSRMCRMRSATIAASGLWVIISTVCLNSRFD